jgi:ubiquitin-like 1-activating enzyme E1 B
LSEFGIKDGTRLTADDFLQNYTLIINIIHSSEALPDEREFLVVSEEQLEEKEDHVDLSVRKRKAPSDDDLILQNTAKRAKDSTVIV